MRKIDTHSCSYLLRLFLIIGCLHQLSLSAFNFCGVGECIYPPACKAGYYGGGGGCCDTGCCDCGYGYEFPQDQSLFMSFIPVVFLEVAFGNTVGVDADYASIGTQIYTAFGDDPAIAFVASFIAHGLNDHGSFAFASNIGIGFRQFDRASLTTRGIHLFFDVREGRKHNYGGVGLSLEYLTRMYRIRINGYYPIGKDSKRIDHEIYSFPGGFVAECTATENSFKGIDGDIEIPLFCLCNWEADVRAGGYYFSSRCSDTGPGGKAALRLAWNNFFAMEGRYTYDRLFGSRGQGVLIFNIPLSGAQPRSDVCDGFMRQLVRRFDIMPLDECCCWDTNF